MTTSLKLRKWATPLTIGSFLLMAGTGVMMFFELEDGLTTVVHQWMSWIFLAGAAAHLAIHFRPLRNHLRSPLGKASFAVFAAILVGSAFSWGMTTGPQLKRPIEERLVEAPLSALADVAGRDIEALLRRFEESGASARGEQSIRQIAALSGADENRLLGLIFLAD